MCRPKQPAGSRTQFAGSSAKANAPRISVTGGTQTYLPDVVVSLADVLAQTWCFPWTHRPTLQRNLLYTGVTRGKRLVVLVGQKKAVAIAVRNVSGRRRWSKLNEWLAEAQ